MDDWLSARSDRSLTPVVGVLVLVAMTVALAVVVAFVAADVGSLESAEPSSTASIELTASADDGELAFEHAGGDDLDVRELTLEVAVDGDPLEKQPPVPFFAADGFHGGPTGPFNPETEPIWTTGKRATLQVAETNDPVIEAGSEIVVTLIVDDRRIATLETTAR